MVSVEILCIGKLKEKYLKEAVDEYSKRLSRYCSFKICELEETKIQNNPSNAQINNVINDEGEKIILKLSANKSNTFVISLCIEGKMLSSEAFSEKIEQIISGGISKIIFIIGGSWGLSESVKKLSDLKLSISDMTFPHQLARVILCEQIYRGFSIINSSKYHK